jgi:hypothetical protein
VPPMRASRLDRRKRAADGGAARRPPSADAASGVKPAAAPQVSAAAGIESSVENARKRPRPVSADAVRCLDCGTVYPKPRGGSSAG